MSIKEKFTISFFLVLTLFLKPSQIVAIENPLSVPNNKFGIHILDENDFPKAQTLLNSQGGDWGYVTIVIREDERNHTRWQNAFNTLRRLHLIPIIRIASKQVDDSWAKPEHAEINNWVAFLNNLNWVVKNRYVIIGNEPNHATEWGNDVNPQEYAEYLAAFSEKLKKASEDFFVLPAALDASAPDNKTHLSESAFLKQMLNYKNNVFDHVDGWNSHSYPNPNFSGSESASGRGTVRTFEWELSLLKYLGVEKNLPVFITETGWAHDMEEKENGFKQTDLIGEKLVKAYQSAWNNQNIVTITPFILNYQGAPFNVFSWTKKDGSFYDFYFDVQNLPKEAGKPVQINSIQTLSQILPEIIKKDDAKWGLAYVKNIGQVIWIGKDIQTVNENDKTLQIEPVSFLNEIEPGKKSLVFFRNP